MCVIRLGPIRQKDDIIASNAKPLATTNAHSPKSTAHQIITTSVTLSGPIMPIAAKGTIANSVAVIAIPKTIALGNFLISSLLLEYPRVNSGTIYCPRNEKTTKLETGIAYFILAKKINSDLRPGPIIDAITN